MKTKLLFVVAAIMSCMSVMGQWNKSTETLLSWSEETLDDNVEMELTPNGSVWFFTQILYSQETSTRLTSCLSMVDSEGNRPLEQAIIVSDYPSKAWIAVGKTLYVDSEGNAIVAVSDRRKGIEEYESYTVYKISPEGEFLWGEDGITLDGENVYSLVSGMSICQLEDSSYIFAWMHNHESNDNLFSIEMQRISAEGEMLWNADDVRLHVDNENYSYPYVVNGGNNQVIMLYAKGTSQDLYARKLDSDGATVWSEDTRIYNGGWGSIPIWTLIDVHPSGDGGLIASWSDDRYYTQIESAYMAYVKSNGEIGFTSENGQMLGYAGLRSLDVSSYYDDTSDSFYAIWRESSAGQSSNRVVAQRISKEGELLWGENGLEIEKMNNNYSYSDFSIQSTDDNEIAFFYLQSSSSTEQIPIVATVHTSDTTFRAKSCISNYISNKRNLQSTPAYNDNWLVSWIEDKQLLIQGVSCELPRLTIGDKFTVDGIHYEVLNESGQVAVTYYGDKHNSIPDEYKYAGEVVIPETVSYQGATYSVTSIGDWAFYDCSGLTEITIPESVTSIGQSAFFSCTGLTEITIPESVTSMGDYAFANCYNLTSIRIEAVNPPAIEEITFNLVDKTIPVYVPQGCAEVYRNAEYWSEFTNILENYCLDANDIKIVKIDDIMKQEEISLPISLINTNEIAGLQCDIFLPDGLTPVMQGDKYDIVLSSRAEGFDVTAKLRNDGALRVVIVNTALDLISGNDGELFTIKLKPNEQYSTDDNIAIRNIVMTGSDYAEYEASDVVISCTIKESITGDSNCDKKVNVTDLSQMANYVAGNELGTFDADGADANQDGLVDSADIDAVSDVVVKASKTEAQNNTEVTETTENRLEAEVIEIVKMDGVVVTNPISLPIALTNTATITAIQCDIIVPAGLTLVVNDDVADITLSERLGDSHVVKSAWLDNGALRVLIYSPTAEGIEGESGTLFTLQLQPNESYQADATIEVKNVTMASTDAVEYNAMPLSISCTVKESFLGDVNRDGKVNVTDVIVTIGKVLNVYDGDFDTVAADIDQDGEITIVDVVAIINLVLDEGDTPSQARMQDEYAEGVLTMQDVKMSRGETKDLVIGLTNEAPYTAFQMDVTLPAGLNIEHIALSGRANGHTLQWQAQADGSVRIVGYALDNATIADNDGALLTLTVSSDSQFETGEVVVSNAIFSTRQLVSHRLERMTAKVSNITALNDVVTATRIYATDHKVVVDSPVAQEAAISTIDGVVQRVDLQPGRNEILLQQGVYIVAVDAEVKKVVIR